MIPVRSIAPSSATNTRGNSWARSDFQSGDSPLILDRRMKNQPNTLQQSNATTVSQGANVHNELKLNARRTGSPNNLILTSRLGSLP